MIQACYLGQQCSEKHPAHPCSSDISADLVLQLLSQLMIFSVEGRKRYLILCGSNKMKHFQVIYLSIVVIKNGVWIILLLSKEDTPIQSQLLEI